jgi:hypothetical protein
MCVTIIAVAVSLVLSISTLHVWAILKKPRRRRGSYLLILVLLIVGTLFIPLDDGGGHTKTIWLWTPYCLLALPEFYRADNRDFEIDSAVIGLPLIQHLTCILLASLAVQKFRRTEQDAPSDGDKHPV